MIRFRELLVHTETWLAAGSLLLLLLLSLIQILARNLFDSGLAGADTLTRYLVLYVTFFGAALAVSRNRHIKIDVCCNFLAARTLRRLYRPMRAIAAVICAFFADAAIRYWLDEWQHAPDHETWLVLVGLVIPAGFCLLTLEFVLAALIGEEDETCCRP